MAEAKATLVNGFQFVAKTGSGHALIIDMDHDVGGRDTGPRPLELLAVSLATCTGTAVIAILRRMQQQVTSFEVDVSTQEAPEHPKKIQEILVNYLIAGHNLNQERVKQAIALSERKFCPVIATLRPGATVASTCRIIEAGADSLIK